MLSVPLKLPDDKKHTDLAHKLNRYLKQNYSKRLALATTNACQTAEKTRNQAVHLNDNATPNEQLLRIKKYKSLLNMIQNRFDLTKVDLQFAWRDAFKPYAKQVETQLSFERAALSFNLAAILSSQAVNEKRSTSDGVRNAARLFQQAAGLLEEVKVATTSHSWGNSCTDDLSPNVLEALQTMMLAQAQRCFYERAVADGKSNKLLAKVAAGVAELYCDAVVLLRSPELRQALDASWADVCEWNLCTYEGLAAFHTADDHAAAFEYGSQVARLTLAAEKLNSAVRLSLKAHPSLRSVYQKELERVEYAKQLAIKDNETIYLEPVPLISSLPAIKGHKTVRALALDELPPPSSSVVSEDNSLTIDPFIHIVPAAVQRELTHFGLVRRQQLETLHIQIEGVVEAGVSKLLELDLPNSLHLTDKKAVTIDDNITSVAVDETSKPRLPQAVEEAISRVHQAGGEQELNRSISHLDELAAACNSKLSSIRSLLAKESDAESEMSQKYGNRWGLVSCGKGAIAAIEEELDEYAGRLLQAREANAKIVERVIRFSSSPGAPLIALPVEEVALHMPQLSTFESVASTGGIDALRCAFDELETVRAEREPLISQCAEYFGETHRVSIERKDKTSKLGLTIIDSEGGVEIDEVAPDGLGMAAGLQVGESILSVNGKLCRDQRHALQLLDKAGKKVTLVMQNAPYDEDCVRALMNRGTTPAQAIFETQLQKLAPLKSACDDFCLRHETSLNAVIAANEKFVADSITQNEASVHAKQAHIRDINEAVANFESIAREAQEGKSYYDSTTEKLDGLVNKVKEATLERTDLATQFDTQSASEEETVPLALARPVVDDDYLPLASVTLEGQQDQAQPFNNSTIVEPDKLRQLMEMGFSRGQSEGALENSQGDVEVALTSLLSAAPNTVATTTTNTTDAGPQVVSELPRPRQVRRQSSGAIFQLPQTLPPKVQQLVDMGFNAEQAALALVKKDNSVQDAAADLLSASGAAAATSQAQHEGNRSAVDLPRVVTMQREESQVEELMSMGFDAAQAKCALTKGDGSVEVALQLLLDDPSSLSSESVGSVPAPTHHSVSPTQAQVQAAPPESTAAAIGADVECIVGMGFSAQQALSALATAKGDRNEAISILLASSTSQQLAVAPPAPPTVPPVSPPFVNPSANFYAMPDQSITPSGSTLAQPTAPPMYGYGGGYYSAYGGGAYAYPYGGWMPPPHAFRPADPNFQMHTTGFPQINTQQPPVVDWRPPPPHSATSQQSATSPPSGTSS